MLVTGGARSGKSLYAEGLVRASARERVYVATCTPHDEEMRQRIDRHRNQRGEGWRTMRSRATLPASSLPRARRIAPSSSIA